MASSRRHALISSDWRKEPVIVDSHVPYEVLARFLQGERSSAENRWVARHLLSGCQRCHGLAQQVISNLSQDGRIDGITEVVQQSLRNLLVGFYGMERQREREGLQAAAQWAKIKDFPQGRRITAVKSSSAYWTWGFFDHLLTEAWSLRHNDTAQAIDFAQLALEVVESLSWSSDFSEYFLFGLRAEAYTAIGNYHRIREDFPPAIEALERAEACMELGTGDIVVEARHTSIRGSLLRDLGNFEDAVKAIRTAIRLFHSAEEMDFEAQNWVGLATILKYLDPQAGIQAAERALTICEPDASEMLFAYAQHARIDCMLECGYGPAALAEFYKHKPVLYKVPAGKHRTNVKFLAGRLAAGLGYQKEALRIFLEVIESYRSQSYYQEMSMAQLNLVWLLIERRKWNVALRIAEQTIQQFQRLGLRKHVLTVWITIRDLLAKHALERETARRAVEMVHRYWKAGIPESVKLAS